jgi:Mg-chelatase subunit ChlD
MFTSNFCQSELTTDSVLMKDEILEVAGKIYKSGMSLLVIDTENKFVSTGFAKEIARVAQGLCSAILLNKHV